MPTRVHFQGVRKHERRGTEIQSRTSFCKVLKVTNFKSHLRSLFHNFFLIFFPALDKNWRLDTEHDCTGTLKSHIIGYLCASMQLLRSKSRPAGDCDGNSLVLLLRNACFCPPHCRTLPRRAHERQEESIKERDSHYTRRYFRS